jgi:ABC-2 type transport system permease protein
LQIRSGSLIAWLTALVEMLVARQLWIALYNGRATYDGFTLDQTLAYVVLSIAITNLLKDDGFLYWKIRSGNIIFELMYPLRLPTHLLVTVAAPLLLMAVFLLKIPLPALPAAWLAFAVSFPLGCLIGICIDLLASLLGFWTTEIHGLMTWKNLTVAILSGAILPLWIFPDLVERAIAWLPFRGIQYVPLSILVGWIGPELYLREMAVQFGWVVVLWFTVEGLYALASRKFEIQGG